MRQTFYGYEKSTGMILIAAAYIVLKEKDLELKDMFSLQPRNWIMGKWVNEKIFPKNSRKIPGIIKKKRWRLCSTFIKPKEDLK